MCLAIRRMGLRVSPSECRLEQDRLSSCLNLMACVITWARLDSIAVVVPESVHNHRGAIPQKPKAPAYDLLFRVCTAASIHLLGRSARKHPASRTTIHPSVHHIKQHAGLPLIYRLHRKKTLSQVTFKARETKMLTWRDSAARFRAEKNQPLTRYDTVQGSSTAR